MQFHGYSIGLYSLQIRIVCDQSWLSIVMEKLTHILRLQEELFMFTWEKWTGYRNQQNNTDVDIDACVMSNS